MLFSMRISLPDRPGMLGALASALGAGDANIVALEVVDHDEGYVVDDLVVEAPEGLTEGLRRAAEVVPGAVVESVRPVDAYRDVLAPLDLAAALSETRSSPVDVLVEQIPDTMLASWCMAVRNGLPLAMTIGAPSLANIEMPWLPLDAPRRLDAAEWMTPAWRMLVRGGLELAAAPLLGDGALVVGRRRGPRFRPSELRQLGLLARVAGAGARV